MDMELPQEKQSWQSVFQPLACLPPSTLSHQKTVLHNSFCLARDSETYEALLTLLDDAILITPHLPHAQPIAALPFTFELKFSAILQE
jgi:hypothetical protein